ncbi:hypothetical protein BMS3Abin14_01479 [bacterium BMS3Abin14]|nr:hypothetical protein BMS3Abin14_01479 [bacterium BMS3Abin14]
MKDIPAKLAELNPFVFSGLSFQSKRKAFSSSPRGRLLTCKGIAIGNAPKRRRKFYPMFDLLQDHPQIKKSVKGELAGRSLVRRLESTPRVCLILFGMTGKTGCIIDCPLLKNSDWVRE